MNDRDLPPYLRGLGRPEELRGVPTNVREYITKLERRLETEASLVEPARRIQDRRGELEAMVETLKREREKAAVDATLRAREMYATGWANAIGEDVQVTAFIPQCFAPVISALKARALKPEQLEVLRRAAAFVDEAAELGGTSDVYTTVAGFIEKARAMSMDLSKLLQELDR